MTKLTKAQFERIRRMLKKKDALTASGILEEARDKNSPLHGLFEWDDTKAAHEYRLMQARQVARRYNITEADPASKLVHVPAVIVDRGDKREGQYKRAGTVVKQITEFERAMSEALSRLKSAQEAVKQLEDLASRQKDDRAGALAALLRSIQVTAEALQRLH